MGWIKTPEEKAAARQKRLDKALFKDDIRKVTAALDAGADPNARNEYRYSAIAYHASSRHNDIVLLLLDRGADPNGKTDNDYSALMAAASHDDVALAKLLCERGANLDAQSNDGRTALHHAAYWGRGKVIQLLLSQGADTSLRDSRMNTAADIAAKENYPGVASLLRGEIGAPAAAETSQPREGWHKTAPQEIARISDKPAIGYRVTEIFNFHAGHYTHIAANLKTGAESQSQRGFDEFFDVSPLREAMDALLSRGGTVEADMQARLSVKAAAPRGLTMGGST